MEMLEVKTLVSEMRNTFNMFINKLDKSRRKKICELGVRSIKMNQTVSQKVKANKELSKPKTKHQDVWDNNK